MGRVPKEGKRRENGETWRRTQLVMLKTKRIYFEPPVAQNTNGPEKQGRVKTNKQAGLVPQEGRSNETEEQPKQIRKSRVSPRRRMINMNEARMERERITR